MSCLPSPSHHHYGYVFHPDPSAAWCQPLRPSASRASNCNLLGAAAAGELTVSGIYGALKKTIMELFNGNSLILGIHMKL